MLTVRQLREILKDESIDDDLPVALVTTGVVEYRPLARTASGSAIIERDAVSRAPATGRVSENRPELLRGTRETVFALYDC